LSGAGLDTWAYIPARCGPPDRVQTSMEAADHILIVDDDADIRELLTEYLRKNGLQASAVADGRQMRAFLASHRADLIVLDLMLPGADGLSLCRDLRAGGQTVPILMLTARGDEADRILGLEMGADDYLAKPFAARELLARIRSVLRRTRMLPPNLREDAEPARCLRFGDWLLDTHGRHLADATGAQVALSGAEYRLLRVFLAHPQRVLTRDQLLSLTQGREADVFDRSIDLLVSRLRQRLGDDAREARYLRTVRNEGYVFNASVAPGELLP
jgi:two-component system OmpR family response regulator